MERGLDLSDSSTILPTYWSTPLTQICIGIKHPDQHSSSAKWIKLVLKRNAKSLLDVMTGDDNQPFQLLGLTAWRVAFIKNFDPHSINSPKHRNDTEGINVNKDKAFVRLGVAGYIYLNDPEFAFNYFIGVGTFDRLQPNSGKDISCGYGDEGINGYGATWTPTLCYIFVQ